MLSLDIHKAFNSVYWSYVSLLLQRYGFQDDFLQAFQALYQNPRTRVKIPGCSSEFFQLGRGTKQGCPLSPLIFTLAIEPLAITILQHPDISGYNKASSIYKFYIMCFYFSPTPGSLCRIFFKPSPVFANIPGLSVNVSKLVALPVGFSPAKLETLKKSFSFIWARSSLSYLGVKLPGNYNSLFDHNFPPMISNLKQLLKTWSPHRIPFLGKITAIKMTILPKLLYLFRALPVKISKSYLLKLQAHFNRFIWKDKPPRFSREVLYRPYRLGGLGVPQEWLYYLASRFSQQAQWNIKIIIGSL